MPPQTPEDARWFAAEVQPHESALRAYIHHKFPTLSDVDDIVQESFLKALHARKTGKLTSARGFLFRVASNAVVSFFRKRKYISGQDVNDVEALCVVESNADVFENVCSQDEIDLISEAIADLPERCRDIVMLRLMHGMEYGLIARQLGVSEATVRVQTARGMKKCGDFLCTRGVIQRKRP